MKHRRLFLLAFAPLCLLLTAIPAQAQQITVTPSKPNGVYAPGEKIVWNLTVGNDPTGSLTSAHYQIRRGGGTVVAEGDTPLAAGVGKIETTQTDPLAYLADITTVGPDKKPVHVYGGAAVSPREIKPSLPRPADFDSFWKANLNALAQVKPNPVVTPGDSGKDGVEYSTVLLDNIGGAKIHAQLARPKVGTKFPAMIILQWAGVYGLPKSNVTSPASQGWLAMNVMAHDLPFDRDPEFYKTAGNTTLKDYVAIGDTSRETSYFLKMLLGCYRASEYLASRPDWDGRVFVATGTSQGGMQSIALAGLQPKVTAVMVCVPAGADTGSKTAGRGVPWPYWGNHAEWYHSGDPAAILETSRYFDIINFASRIRVPTLVAFGLIDQTSTPSGVLAMANQIKGPVEYLVMPLSEHQDRGGTQAKYYQRAGAWQNALKKGEQPPVERAF